MVTLKKAGWKATGGGLAGGAAMFVNVGALMCARTLPAVLSLSPSLAALARALALLLR